MGLKIKQIAELKNEYGYTAKNTKFSIASVNFDYKKLSISIQWELTPADWVEGLATQSKYQTIGLSDLGGTEIGLLLAVSDALHEKAETVAFLPSAEGAVSFADMNATTVDVGMPEIK